MGRTDPKKIKKLLDVLIDIDIFNSISGTELFDLESLGQRIETTKLQCIIPQQNTMKYYHITLYSFGFVAYYGRLDENQEPKTKITKPFIKRYNSNDKARLEYEKKVTSKLFPPTGKDKYEFVDKILH